MGEDCCKGKNMAKSQLSEVNLHLRRSILSQDGAGLTDGRLLEEFISCRDEAALAALVRRHGPMVWSVCRRVLRDHHEAEDAFQTAFLVLARKAASIVPREMVANWLYGVAHRTALKARATVARRKGREGQVTGMPEPAAAEQGHWVDLQPLLDEELSRLPDKYRVVIVLCDLEGKTRKEAARQLGVPEGTVAGHVARARALLAKRLARRGLAVSGGALAAVLTQKAAACVPPSVVSSTIKSAGLFEAGQAAAEEVVPVKTITLIEGVLNAMLQNKLRKGTAVLLVLGMVTIGGLHIPRLAVAEQSNKVQSVGKKGGGDVLGKQAEIDRGKKAEQVEGGTLRATLEKVDPKDRIITVTRLGKLVGGLGDARGGLGVFKNNVRLENLPVGKAARILLNGKTAELADLKPDMSVSLKLEVKGDITVQEIKAEDQ